MRIRTQLLAALWACIALGVMGAILIVHAAREESLASDVQARAQDTSHQVSGLLVLTQEYARHTETRSAQQWHQRHSAIAHALNADEKSRSSSPALQELRAVTRSLPDLFNHLEGLPLTSDALTVRRKELLIDQLLTNTQAMSDFAYQWYQEAAETQRAAERVFLALATGTPPDRADPAWSDHRHTALPTAAALDGAA